MRRDGGYWVCVVGGSSFAFELRSGGYKSRICCWISKRLSASVKQKGKTRVGGRGPIRIFVSGDSSISSFLSAAMLYQNLATPLQISRSFTSLSFIGIPISISNCSTRASAKEDADLETREYQAPMPLFYLYDSTPFW